MKYSLKPMQEVLKRILNQIKEEGYVALKDQEIQLMTSKIKSSSDTSAIKMFVRNKLTDLVNIALVYNTTDSEKHFLIRYKTLRAFHSSHDLEYNDRNDLLSQTTSFFKRISQLDRYKKIPNLNDTDKGTLIRILIKKQLEEVYFQEDTLTAINSFHHLTGVTYPISSDVNYSHLCIGVERLTGKPIYLPCTENSQELSYYVKYNYSNYLKHLEKDLSKMKEVQAEIPTFAETINFHLNVDKFLGFFEKDTLNEFQLNHFLKSHISSIDPTTLPDLSKCTKIEADLERVELLNGDKQSCIILTINQSDSTTDYHRLILDDNKLVISPFIDNRLKAKYTPYSLQEIIDTLTFLSKSSHLIFKLTDFRDQLMINSSSSHRAYLDVNIQCHYLGLPVVVEKKKQAFKLSTNQPTTNTYGYCIGQSIDSDKLAVFVIDKGLDQNSIEFFDKEDVIVVYKSIISHAILSDNFNPPATKKIISRLTNNQKVFSTKSSEDHDKAQFTKHSLDSGEWIFDGDIILIPNEELNADEYVQVFEDSLDQWRVRWLDTHITLLLNDFIKENTKAFVIDNVFVHQSVNFRLIGKELEQNNEISSALIKAEALSQDQVIGLLYKEHSDPKTYIRSKALVNIEIDPRSISRNTQFKNINKDLIYDNDILVRITPDSVDLAYYKYKNNSLSKYDVYSVDYQEDRWLIKSLHPYKSPEKTYLSQSLCNKLYTVKSRFHHAVSNQDVLDLLKEIDEFEHIGHYLDHIEKLSQNNTNTLNKS